MGWLHHGIVAMAALSSIIPQTLALPSPISSNANQRREPCAVIAQAQEEQRKKDSFGKLLRSSWLFRVQSY